MPDTKLQPAVGSFHGLDENDSNERRVHYVIAQVQFGQAARKCRGAGICKVDLYINIRNRQGVLTCNRAICRVGVMGADIVLVFDRYALCRRLVNKYFCNGRIFLREDLELDMALCKKLNIPSTVVSAGKYALIQEGSRSIIVFEKASLRDKKPNH
jgi:hypothetical protein